MGNNSQNREKSSDDLIDFITETQEGEFAEIEEESLSVDRDNTVLYQRQNKAYYYGMSN